MFCDLNEYSNNKSESVHISNYPSAEQKLISHSIERKMLYAQKISSLVHSIRKKEKIKVRQPLSAILIPVNSKEVEKDLRSVEKIILSEVNVKKVKYVYDNSKVFIKKIKPNYKKLGSLYGAEMSNVSKRIIDMNQD